VAGRFVNKVALVVGAAGRGRPLCRALQADGAQVIGADRDQAGLMADAGSPTLVRDGADESALYVLMPMRV
jgi:NAD(P)-dependent dehydrogenase (short-subunit alcohol dehydrogenase family)